MNSVPSKACHSAQSRWFVARYKPHASDVAERNLLSQRFGVFLPKLRQTQRVGQRFVEKIYPLFPGYIFIKASSEAENWTSINGTRGISHLIKFGSNPATISGQIVQALKARCDSSDTLLPLASLAEGQMVKIGSGPFANFIATVEQVDNEKRIMLLVDMLGRDVRLTAPAGIIHPA